MSDTVHLFIIGILASSCLGCYGYAWRLAKAAGTDLERQRLHAAREVQRLEQNFYEYKLHVAQNFATLLHLRESEQRMQHTLSDIGSKLDRLIEGRIK